MITRSNKLDFEGQEIFVGFDVHKRSWSVTIMSEKLTHNTFSMSPNPDELFTHLTKNYPGASYHSAYEAGFSGYWIHNRLKELGVDSIVVNAADIPTTHKEKVQKEDKRDSRKIARELRKGTLEGIFVPSSKTLEDRSLVRTRSTLVKEITRNKNRVKAFLHFRGIMIPEALDDKWSKAFMAWLKSVELPEPTSKSSLDILIDTLEHLRGTLLQVTRQIRKLSQTDHYKARVSYLRSIPGIGLITSMQILTEIDNITRFRNFDSFCSFIGLMPSTSSSGEKEKVGPLTPRGHSVLRSAIIESAWTAARVDPVLTKSYHNYCRRMDSNKAIVRVARKLLRRIRFVLLNNTYYVKGTVE